MGLMEDQPSAHSEAPFHPISGSRAHAEVIDQVTFAIRAGFYSPGDRLPTVENLARTFRVSKPVVGEAIKILSRSGVIEARRGAAGGLVVLTENIPPHVMRMSERGRTTSLLELVEARRPIETEIALLAGERASVNDFRALGDAIDKYGRYCYEDHTLRLHYDHLFHYTIGQAARSNLLSYYQHQILEQLAVILEHYYLETEDPEHVLETHRDTLAAIKSRDPNRIRRAMDTHLLNLETLASAEGVSPR